MRNLGFYERVSYEDFEPVYDALNSLTSSLVPRVDKSRRSVGTAIQRRLRSFSDPTAFVYNGDRQCVKVSEKNLLGFPGKKITRVYHELIFPGPFNGAKISAFEKSKITENNSGLGVELVRSLVLDHDDIDVSSTLKGTIRTGLKYAFAANGEVLIAPITRSYGFEGVNPVSDEFLFDYEFVQMVKYEKQTPNLHLDISYDKPSQEVLADFASRLISFTQAESVRQTTITPEIVHLSELHTEDMRLFAATLQAAGLQRD